MATGMEVRCVGQMCGVVVEGEANVIDVTQIKL